MALMIGKNRNINDAATIAVYTLNATTSTIIKTAGESFIYFQVTNISNRDVYIKLQAASVDNDAKGILILSGGGSWEMQMDNIYTGEISAITAAGNGKDVHVTQY